MWFDVGLEQIHETFSVQKGWFYESTGTGQKELIWDCVEQSILYLGVGGGKDQGSFQKDFSYAKEDLGDPEDLVIVKLRLFLILARH